MNRKHVKYDLRDFISGQSEIKNTSVELFIDTENKDNLNAIKEILKNHRKKFQRILYVMLKNRYDSDLYSQEGEGVTAMKFKGKFSGNIRIYCKEIFRMGKKIIMITAYYKKVQKNKDDKKIKNIIDNIKSFNYEIN